MEEFRTLLAPLQVTVRSPDDCGLAPHPDEDTLEVASTFAENASAKAHWFASRSGLVTLADDSGLEVDALHGAPGVYSKRFAGFDGPDHEVTAANNAALLEVLREVPEAARSARYRCVLALHRPLGADWLWTSPAAGETLVVPGVTEGRILDAADGEGGFGYDPLFFSFDLGMPFGRASRELKGSVSHRGHAVRALLTALQLS